MRFEVFDRDAVATAALAGPAVRVSRAGILLSFNGPAWEFLAAARWPTPACVVSLGFDVETRTVAVQAVVAASEPGTRWPVVAMRSVEWPHAVRAKPFVDHYRVRVGEYPARLLRGPGPRMVTFEVGPAVSASQGSPRRLTTR